MDQTDDINRALYHHHTDEYYYPNPQGKQHIAACQAMTGRDHAMAAARLLAVSTSARNEAEALLLARAQVHATLAAALREDTHDDTDDDADGM